MRLLRWAVVRDREAPDYLLEPEFDELDHAERYAQEMAVDYGGTWFVVELAFDLKATSVVFTAHKSDVDRL